ncbi:MAG: sugar transferase [Acidobacteriia bacterium]|nr:sugar transferase [Terriglobia bacterium]
MNSNPNVGSMLKRKNRITAIVLALLESALSALSFVIAFGVRRALPFQREIYPLGEYSSLLAAILILWAIIAVLLDAYRVVERQENIVSVRKAVQQVAIGGGLVFVMVAALKLDLSRSLIGIFLIINLLSLSVFRVSTKRLRRAVRKRFGGFQYFIVVGTSDEGLAIARMIHDHEVLGAKLSAIVRVSNGEENIEKAQAICPTLKTIEELPELVHGRVVDEIIFAVPKEKLAGLEEIFLLCEEEGVKTRILLNLFPHVISRMQLDWLESTPLLTFSTTPDNEYLLFLKRSFDFWGALVLAVIFSPLMLVVSLLVKLTSRGPVIFRQTRCGLGGRQFTLYKFRSMVEGAEAQKSGLEALNELDGPVFKVSNDPRCTPVGRLLRKLSIDELPQLINILKGDMSFVGPRPPLPDEVAKYRRWQRRRLRMRPGLTCLWILEGRSNLNFERWMQLDLEYIDNWSIFLDLKILLKTVPIVLSMRGAH